MERLRVLYNPQVPGKPYTREVSSLEDAALVADTLTSFSDFEYKNNIKPDYSDALDLEVYEDGEWVTWYSLDGEDFNEYRESNKL